MTDTEPDSPTALRAGTELAGRYRLERPLGEGGMGIVWEARQITTQKAVAIKVLKGNDAADTARFVREARVAAGLQHRNIIQVFDFWEVEGTGPVFMVMELLRGETLASLLARMGRLSFNDALSVLVPVAQAIRAAHAEGVVHRDLKPENVLLAKAGSGGSEADGFEVKVLDFGLAKPMVSMTQATAVTHTGSVMGTPFYMAPEQVYGEKDIDGRADVWAFGVLVYECLSGGRPFFGENYGQVFRQISSGRYKPLRELVPDLPPMIDSLIARMLTHDRDRRLANIGEAIDGLMTAAANPADPPRPFIAQPTLRIASQPPEGMRGLSTPGAGAGAHPPAATMLAAATSVSRPARPIPLKVLAAFAALGGAGLLVLAIVLVTALRTPEPIVTTAPLVTPTEVAPLPPPTSTSTASTGPVESLVSPTSAPTSTSRTVKRAKLAKELPKDPSRDPLSGGRF
jgi:serine/threonine-protein kinase